MEPEIPRKNLGSWITVGLKYSIGRHYHFGSDWEFPITLPCWDVMIARILVDGAFDQLSVVEASL